MIVVIGAGIAGLSRGARRSGDRRVGGGGTRLPTGVRRLPDWTAKRPTTCCSYARTNSWESTYHAQGGVACAIFSDDDPQLHTADTMAAGHGLCDRTAVDVLTDERTPYSELIAADGMDRGDDGSVLRGLEAAHCRSRVVHAGRRHR